MSCRVRRGRQLSSFLQEQRRALSEQRKANHPASNAPRLEFTSACTNAISSMASVVRSQEPSTLKEDHRPPRDEQAEGSTNERSVHEGFALDPRASEKVIALQRSAWLSYVDGAKSHMSHMSVAVSRLGQLLALGAYRVFLLTVVQEEQGASNDGSGEQLF